MFFLPLLLDLPEVGFSRGEMMEEQKDIRPAMAELLSALGFEQMAIDVKTETDKDRLRKYAWIIMRNAPEEKRRALATAFNSLNII